MKETDAMFWLNEDSEDNSPASAIRYFPTAVFEKQISRRSPKSEASAPHIASFLDAMTEKNFMTVADTDKRRISVRHFGKIVKPARAVFVMDVLGICACLQTE